MDRQPPGARPATSRAANGLSFRQAEDAPTNRTPHAEYYTGTDASSSGMATCSSTTGTSHHGNNGEKDRLYRGMAAAYSHIAPQERPVFSPSSDPFVQTDNRLTEDYSRRIHCYISETPGDTSAPRDHMPPPVLPPFGSLRSEQDMPFWRPPRVLQRDPHYNQAAPHFHASLSSLNSEQRRHALSPRRRASAVHSQNRPAPPFLAIDCTQRTRDQTSDYSSSNSNDHDCDIDPENADDSYGRDGSQLPGGFSTSAKASGLKLPPIDRGHGVAREPMSIACLVDADDSTTTALATRQSSQQALPSRTVVLPQIANLVSANGCPSRRVSALALAQLRCPAAPHHITQQAYEPRTSPRKRSYGATEAAMSLHKMARVETRPPPADSVVDSQTLAPWRASAASAGSPNLVVITCYHASVAQKSYGGEKRFLCPPPAVLMRGEGCSARISHHSPMLLSVITDVNIVSSPSSPTEPTLGSPSQPSRVSRRGDFAAAAAAPASGGGASSGSECGSASAQPSSSAHAPLECQTSFNERNVALFKSLHVTGMQKAKSFRLRLDLLAPSVPCEHPYAQEPRPLLKSQVYASLESDPVAIISKPSKKTAKARNQSTCIRAGSLISLFNRINSQTFRTKYLNVDHLTNRWVAQSHNWSPLEVVVMVHRDGSSPAQSALEAGDCRPLYYGSEIVLVESRRNFRSPPMIIHKVERGRYVENACSPVSQMQKIALQLKPMAPGEPLRFLKADAGHYGPTGDTSTQTRFDDPDGSPELTFETLDDTSATGTGASNSLHGDDGMSELDDAFCWTIVGISAFTYSYSLPPEQSQPLCRINTIPRIFHAWVVDSNFVHVRAQNLDLSTMRFELAGQSLDAESCSRQSEASKSAECRTRDIHGTTGGTRSELGELFAIKLPEDARASGSLSIRRADGVLYHTRWSLCQHEGGALEAVAIKLDI
ncbi:hypothetical protein GGI20_001406 [Coemansia sp. BCRC 34301]|nr:hypothetical protein GGI20_001406 [Coemansia sp. BCRC 34301]